MVTKPNILAFLQFFFFGIVFFSGQIWPQNSIAGLLIASSLLLGFWAVWTMRRHSQLRVRPDATDKTKLISKGPYQYIRHPMYTSIFSVTAGLIANQITITRAVSSMMLIIILFIKANYEESLLLKKLKEYKSYQTKTYKFFPGII